MIVGVDEVGRGCWAGPLVAGAVLLKSPIAGLTDSKLLSAKRRSGLATVILQNSDYGLGWVSAEEVDHLGLTKAVKLAMQRAISQIQSAYDQIIVDGNINFLSDNSLSVAQIRADLTVPAVSAASIIAKVARDEFMIEQTLLYPNYSFDRHVGYGTAAHQKELETFGICDLHRKSYKPVMKFL